MSRLTERLDAFDLAVFKRELEAIDTRVFEEKLPAYKARQLIPTISGVAAGDRVYTYRMFKQIGKAKFAGDSVTDAPRADVTGAETSQHLSLIEASYGYNIQEIQAASKLGRPLDQMRAMNARRALEQLIDETWAWGDAAHGLSGLLNYTGIGDFPGSGAWGTLATADPKKVSGDIMGICNFIVEATVGAFDRFRVLLPIDAYNVAAMLRMGDGTDTTALQFAKANSPYIQDVVPWFRCSSSATGSPLSNDVMVAYPVDETVVGGLVQEIDFLPPQEKGLEFEIPGYAMTGGVVCRYPVAVASCDDIS